jgi:dihydropteroate synthase
VVEVRDFLWRARRACIDAGIARERIALDPGFGFGKTLAHNLALLRALGTLAATGYPVVAGCRASARSGRSPGGASTSGCREPRGRAVRVGAGAAIVRVHDVRATVDA